MENENTICPVLEYAEKVLSGEIIAGELVKLACQRHINDLEKSKNVAFPYYFDSYAADHAIDFYNYLKHSKGKWARQPFVLELWQKFIVGSLFGWLNKNDQLRRFRTAYDEIPRKNGKSTLAAGIGNYLTIADEEYGAEVYAAATKKEQAKITFDEAARMVKASPDLMKHVRVYANNLHAIETGSKFEPLSADSGSLDGLNVHGGLIDEYHAHKNANMYHVIESGTSAREQPLIFVITTAGVNQNGPCYQLREYALKVLKGIETDDTFFAYIATIDEGDDPFDPAVWAKANPNLGVSKNLDYMIKQAAKAKHMPSAYIEFMIKDLNVWVNASVKWMNLTKWDASAGSLTPELLESLKGRKCYGGLDLSSRHDITAFVLVFPPLDKDGEWIILPHFWIPGDEMQEREERDGVPYRDWEKNGSINTTEGNIIDYDFIEKKINDLSKEYNIVEIGFDDWNATQTTLRLTDDGQKMISIKQGYKSHSEPMKELEAMILAERFRHGGHPVLRWMADNVVARTDPNMNIAINKVKSTARVDGISATLNALNRALLHQPKKPSIYVTRGATSL